ncbi:MAG: SDR family NAD(P)-dependent oxidoreductase [Candidatus Omnitrophica bacterium]|nr:SDR family NAD(P)-dependent oxidoreductase [Candidatus Omnitrophota bacterium]
MNFLVTGGSGFIGRWVVKKLLENAENEVSAIDNLSNSTEANIAEFKQNPKFTFVRGDVRDEATVSDLFSKKQFDCCIHAAAQIDVQKSIDNPAETFESDVKGTFVLLEQARKKNVKLVFMSTCMVYSMAGADKAIDELHPIKPASPYAGAKIAGENLALSYYHAYGLPVSVARPFNTYGPFQKTNMEGGVVAIFIKRALECQTLSIFGNGTQTRDLLFVEDCADFLISMCSSNKAVGQIINAGSGQDIPINDLALLICGDKNQIKHVPHHHPQAEIYKLLCDYSKARQLLNWEPKTSLEQGIEKTRDWIKQNTI